MPRFATITTRQTDRAIGIGENATTPRRGVSLKYNDSAVLNVNSVVPTHEPLNTKLAAISNYVKLWNSIVCAKCCQLVNLRDFLYYFHYYAKTAWNSLASHTNYEIHSLLYPRIAASFVNAVVIYDIGLSFPQILDYSNNARCIFARNLHWIDWLRIEMPAEPCWRRKAQKRTRMH